MSLKARMIARIQDAGPMSIAEFMAMALFDPKQGFYPTRDPLGVDGDFITAPEISQIFGELIGLWCVQSWRDLGRPNPVQLIELGPGRGVMMDDILRGARVDPEFLAAVNITLVEASSALEAKQAQTLAHTRIPISWVDGLDKAPSGHALILGNEFIDCLPIRQFIFKDGAWHERIVTIDPKNETALIFALNPSAISTVDAQNLPDHPTPKEGDLLETCPGAVQLAAQLAERFNQDLGRALFIDYGPAETEFGDSLQAIRKHKKVDPLAAPGTADLTARVDFAAFAKACSAHGLTSFAPITQASLLSRLGFAQRAEILAKTHSDQADVLKRQAHRLTHASEMGELFKAVSIQSAGQPYPPAFGEVIE